MKRKLQMGASLLAVGLMVGGAGMLTANLPDVMAGLVNGINLVNQGVGSYSNLEPGQLTTNLQATNCCGPNVPVDTNRQGGAAPQSVGATPFQIAGTLLEGLQNTQTSTVHAATSNTLGGVVITEAVTTAAGANYIFTLTNSQINAAYNTSGNTPSVGIYSISNTGGTNPPRTTAQMTLLSAVAATGSVTWTWRNDGNTALNGTMYIAWHL